MERDVFVEKYAAVFEHSPWVAEAVFESAGDAGLTDIRVLSERFKTAFMQAPPERQLATLQAHPQLACGLADALALTPDSAGEQAGAGLDQCSDAEFASFKRLNAAYSEKFGFPFIIAVRGRDRFEILRVFRARLKNDTVLEYQTALRETCMIAGFRIGDILNACQ